MNIHREDLFKFLRENKRMSLVVGLVSFVFISSLLLLREPKFRVHSTFQQSVHQDESAREMLSRFVKGQGGKEEALDAKALFLSRRLIGDVIDEMGLQVQFKKKWERLSFISENLNAEVRNTIADCEKPFASKVSYSGEKILNLQFQNEGDKSYLIDGKRGSLGSRFAGENFWLYIEKRANNGSKYQLQIVPREKLIDGMRKRLRVRADKDNRSIIHLSFTHRDRNLAKRFLETLIHAYENYLKGENQRLAKAQLSYLSMREGMLTHQLEQSLSDYREKLQENVKLGAFLTVKDEIYHQRQRKKQIESHLFDLQVEKQELQSGTCMARSSPIADEIRRLGEEKLKLEREKQRSALSVLIPSAIQVNAWITNRQASLKHLDKEKKKLEKIAKGLPDGDYEKISAMFETYRDLLNENPFFEEEEGLDIEMAKQCLLDYSKELDRLQIELSRNQELIGEIKKKKKPLSSFHLLAVDTISNEMVKVAHQIEQQLGDSKNLTEHEKARLRKSLKRHRKSLVEHLTNQQGSIEKKAEVLKAKRDRLKRVYHHHLNHELKLVDQKKQNLMDGRQKQLDQELNFVGGQLQKIQDDASSLPDRWYWENLLKLRTTLSKSVIDGLSKIVEAKTIEHHIRQLESRVIDAPFLPVKPESPLLIPIAILVSCFIACATLFVKLAYRMTVGLPASLKRLEDAGFIACNKEEWLQQIDWKASTLSILMGSDEMDLKELVAGFEACGRKAAFVLIQPNFGKFEIKKIQEKNYRISLPEKRYECLMHHDYCQFFDDISRRFDVIVHVFLQTSIREVNTQILTEINDQIVVATQGESFEEISKLNQRANGQTPLLLLI